LSSTTRVYELSDDAFWRYFKAFIDDADRRLDTQDGAYLRKWIDLDTALKISILDRLLVMAAIKGGRNNGIVVPEWLDFEPCRTRYIKAQKAYIKLCHR